MLAHTTAAEVLSLFGSNERIPKDALAAKINIDPSHIDTALSQITRYTDSSVTDNSTADLVTPTDFLRIFSVMCVTHPRHRAADNSNSRRSSHMAPSSARCSRPQRSHTQKLPPPTLSPATPQPISHRQHAR